MNIDKTIKKYKQSLLANGYKSIMDFGIKKLDNGNIESLFLVMAQPAGILYDGETEEEIVMMNPGKWYEINSSKGEELIRSYIQSDYSKLYILRSPEGSGKNFDVYEDFYEI